MKPTSNNNPIHPSSTCVQRDYGDVSSLYRPWRRQDIRPFTGAGFIAAHDKFASSEGVVPASHVGYVNFHAGFARSECFKRRKRNRDLARAYERVATVSAQCSEKDTRLDFERALTLIYTELNPEELSLLLAIITNESNEDWDHYERQHGIDRGLRYVRIHRLRKKLRRLLAKHGMADILMH